MKRIIIELTDEDIEWARYGLLDPDFLADKVKNALAVPERENIEKIKAEIDEQYKWLMQTKHTLYDIDIAFSGIKAIINSLPSAVPEREKGEWIPVSERLPEESKNYLVVIRERFNEDHWWIDICDIDTDGFAKTWNVCEPYYVEAWQPLPEPYKAESEDKE